MQIDVHEVEGVIYYEMTAKGSRYSLRRHQGKWELYSKRLALGRSHFGGFRTFNSLEEIEAAIKCFQGIAAVIGDMETNKEAAA